MELVTPLHLFLTAIVTSYFFLLQRWWCSLSALVNIVKYSSVKLMINKPALWGSLQSPISVKSTRLQHSIQQSTAQKYNSVWYIVQCPIHLQCAIHPFFLNLITPLAHFFLFMHTMKSTLYIVIFCQCLFVLLSCKSYLSLGCPTAELYCGPCVTNLPHQLLYLKPVNLSPLNSVLSHTAPAQVHRMYLLLNQH